MRRHPVRQVATDAVSHVGFPGGDYVTLDIEPTDKGVGMVVRLTCLFLVPVILEFNSRFSLGLDADLHAWLKAISAIRIEDDDE